MRPYKFLAGALVAPLICLYVALAMDSKPAFFILLILWFTALSAGTGWSLGVLRSRHPRRKGALTVGALGIGLTLTLLGLGVSRARTGRIPISVDGDRIGFSDVDPAAIPAVIGGFLIWMVVSFFFVGDLVGLLTRNARSIRTRMVALGLLSGLLVYIGDVRFEGVGGALLAVLIGGASIFGFAYVLSHRFTSRLGEVVAAMKRATGGDLSVQVATGGRDEVAQLASTFNEMIAGLRERQFLETAFGRYVSPDVLASLRSASRPAELRTATVLYADIRGYTSLSEQCSAEEMLKILNTYFDAMIEVISAHGGYINKFIGDAVMVVFNAPMDQPDHADRAVRCAREMQRVIAELNAGQRFGPGRELKVGIGINTGEMVAGTLGSERRAEYAVIGDPVNVAARFTSHAGAGEILVGESTARTCSLALQELPPVELKGKSQPLPVFRAA